MTIVSVTTGRDPPPPVTLPGTSTSQPERAGFARNGKGFVKLIVRGALLELVTFGFYRFWLVTDIRRHLWSHTSVDGDRLEYTGRGRELLFGFLFALAILVPVYLGYFLLGLEAERIRAFASLPLFLFFFLFGQFAVYRARRYRLTRTLWRGVRFWMRGSGWIYALWASLWGVLVFVTLGLAWPWRVAALENYKMRHTYYGTLQGSFDGRGWTFFKRGWWIWLICTIALCGLAAVIVLTALNATRPTMVPALLGRLGTGPSIAIGVVSAVCLIATPFLWPIFRAIEWRWWAQGLRIGAVAADSDFPKGTILKLYLKFFVIAGLVSSCLSALAVAIGAIILERMGISLLDSSKAGKAALELFAQQHAFLTIGGPAAAYLVILLATGVVQRFFFQHEMWRTVMTSLSFTNLTAADDVEAMGEAANALGEGLVDGLDLAGF